ncbi:MAG: DUF305 domain-containing protein [Synechocystis sp.]|jgi:uncharacterized protein (DUF305 family)
MTYFFRGVSALLMLAAMGLTACAPPTKTEDTEALMTESPTEEGQDHAMGEMDLGPKDENFDLRFIDAMILHHQGAIAMAEALQANSQRPELKQLAQAIIAAQNQEIEQMQQWRQTWYSQADSQPMMYHSGMNHMMPMDEKMQASMRMDQDLGTADPKFDLRFINAMIPHHQGAVVMAQQVLDNGDRPELKQLAQAIITAQNQEIEQMQQWRKDWYGK